MVVNLPGYYHTIRHPRPTQFYGRLRSQWYRPLPQSHPAPEQRTQAGGWEHWHWRIRVLYANKTVVIVAHRLSTVEQYDHLYRLERGQVVEQSSTAAILGKAAALSDR